MVQGGLLTDHPRSVHGGEAPGGHSSLRLTVLPIIEVRRRRNRGEIAKKGSVFGGFGTRGKYRPKGGQEGGLGGPGGHPARQPGGAHPQCVWTPGGPLWPYIGALEGSVSQIFYIYLWEFFGHFK